MAARPAVAAAGAVAVCAPAAALVVTVRAGPAVVMRTPTGATRAGSVIAAIAARVGTAHFCRVLPIRPGKIWIAHASSLVGGKATASEQRSRQDSHGTRRYQSSRYLS